MPVIINDVLISNQEQNIRAAMSNDPKMREVIQHHIREALMEVRRQVMSDVPAENDPRGARHAIRTSVYKKILGGNINILNGKKAHGSTSYQPPRTLQPHQRGGNRRLRGERTKQLMSYAGADRGFVLRFLNSGTKTRYAGYGRNGRTERQREAFISRINGMGHRGYIAARNWFRPSAEAAMAQALQNIAEMIEIEAQAVLRGEQ